MNIRFGTDGVRGPVGQAPITPEAFNILGQACVAWLDEQGFPLKVAIGWDTRASGPGLAQAFAEGFASFHSAHIIFLGITPTPAISFFVTQKKMSLGVAITASHNPYTDNGLKLFKYTGSKLTREEESSIEVLCLNKVPRSSSSAVQNVSGSTNYLEHFKSYLPQNLLQGQRIVLDTANGATTYTTLPLLQYLGADLICRGTEPNGMNINHQCGSESVANLLPLMKAHNAWLGFAHDGDGDRLVVIDETGRRVDGDQLLGLLALEAEKRRTLRHHCLVVTEQSNSGLKTSLAKCGIRVHICDIGDREVFYALEAIQGNLGGENSGHIILKDEAPTGDGLRTLLRLLDLAQQRPLAERRLDIQLNPKCETAFSVTSKPPLKVLTHLQVVQQALQKEVGRVYVRYSGTENKLRFLVEAETEDLVREHMSMLLRAAKLDFQ